MVSSPGTGWLIIVVGAVAAFIGAFASPLGIGDPGFYWRQGLLLGVGLVLIAVGVFVVVRASGDADRESGGGDGGPSAPPGA